LKILDLRVQNKGSLPKYLFKIIGKDWMNGNDNLRRYQGNAHEILFIEYKE